MTATRFVIREIELYERPAIFRLPFRYGIVTLTEAPQAFIRIRLEQENGASAWGMAGELLAPKWFDKNPAWSNEDNFNQLRLSFFVSGAGCLPASFCIDRLWAVR